jgi:hypothetical protein
LHVGDETELGDGHLSPGQFLVWDDFAGCLE